MIRWQWWQWWLGYISWYGDRHLPAAVLPGGADQRELAVLPLGLPSRQQQVKPRIQTYTSTSSSSSTSSSNSSSSILFIFIICEQYISSMAMRGVLVNHDYSGPTVDRTSLEIFGNYRKVYFGNIRNLFDTYSLIRGNPFFPCIGTGR